MIAKREIPGRTDAEFQPEKVRMNTRKCSKTKTPLDA
jgi:hypothetical protein